MPSITNDSPPMNEIVLDGVNGVCVDSVRWGEAGSGIPAFDPDFGQLTAAIERLGDAGERERLAAGAIELRAERAQLAAHRGRPRGITPVRSSASRPVSPGEGPSLKSP